MLNSGLVSLDLDLKQINQQSHILYPAYSTTDNKMTNASTVLDMVSFDTTATTVSGELGDVDVDCNVQNVVYSFIGCIGVLDNSFVLFIMYMHKPLRQQLNNLHIINQSVIDLISSIFVLCIIPLCGDNRIVRPDSNMLAEQVYCKLWHNRLPFWCFALTSTYNLVLLTLDRYFSIVHAIWYKSFVSKNKIYVSLGLAWVIGLGLYVPFGILTSGVVDGVCIIWELFSDYESSLIAGVINFVAAFAFPIILMTACYIHMAIVITNQAKVGTKSSAMSKSEQERHAKMTKIKINILKTMATVSILFLVCWLPSSIRYMASTAGIPTSTTDALYHFTVYAANTNCILNPFIYLTGYKQFQQGVIVVIMKRKGGKQRDTTSSVLQ